MSAEPEVDLAHIHWYSPEWIYALPTRTLSTPEEAMDYFALSPFFDPLSNNNNLRVQRMVTDPFYGYAKAQFELPRYVSGFEYVPAHTLPPDMFVIHRREITDKGSRNNVTGIWFILEGKIYPAPNVYDTMATRLKNASHLISTAFSSLAATHPPSNPRAHPVWRSLPPDVPADVQNADKADDSVETDPSAAAVTQQSSLPNFALLNALQSTRSSIAELSALAQKPASRIEPHDELKKIEQEIMGVTSAHSAIPGAPRTIRSASAAPSQRDRATSTAGTPAFRMLGPRTPGAVPASSPLTNLHYGP